MRRPRHASLLLAVVLTAVANGRVLRAQSSLTGSVRHDSTRQVIAGAEVSVARLALATTTDSAGRFRLVPLPEGEHLVVVRAPGFAPETVDVSIGFNETFTRDFVLRLAVTRLGAVRVAGAMPERTPAVLAEFEDRRRAGAGRFLDRAQIARWEGRRTGDMLATLPGLDVRRSLGNKAWVTSGRAVSPGKCAFCRGASLDRADAAAGAGAACYSDVYLDGALVFDSMLPGTPLFDVNSLQVSHVQAVEFYPSAAAMPAKFNRTAGGCGAILIWTRVK